MAACPNIHTMFTSFSLHNSLIICKNIVELAGLAEAMHTELANSMTDEACYGGSMEEQEISPLVNMV